MPACRWLSRELCAHIRVNPWLSLPRFPSISTGNDCETFWDKDHLTNSCYQFNFQSTLSWREAWSSCEQQGANLLSITEIHEQTYINGEPALPCWGWPGEGRGEWKGGPWFRLLGRGCGGIS